MRPWVQCAVSGILLCSLAEIAPAAAKPHVIVFGKWTNVKVLAERGQGQPLELKVRPLYLDTKLREYTFGIPHEITEHVFVVRRIIRVNDALPEEASDHWVWQRNGWLAVDRSNGHISLVNLPEFDPELSTGVWYRDYVAYCGISGDGKKLSAVVMQLGRRRPVLRKAMGEVGSEGRNATGCSSPVWERLPPRVTFFQAEQKVTFAIRGHAVESVSDADEDEAGTE